MNVLLGCEYSATVGTEFHRLGHDVLTCDLLPSESDEVPHFQGDVFEALRARRWDLIILHPPCTALCVAGNRHYSGTKEREQAINWTVTLWDLAIHRSKRVALENPVGVLSNYLGPATQYVQPWQFGHRETKKTGLWLHNLPALEPTDIVGPPPPAGSPERKPWERVWRMAPSPERGHERSRFFTGIAAAMAEQWGNNQCRSC